MTAPSLGRVLIVDDEAELMTALCESLTDQGYEALGRTSAHEALTLLHEQDIDLLVCDLVRVDETQQQIDTRGLVALARVDALIGRPEHTRTRVDQIFE